MANNRLAAQLQPFTLAGSGSNITDVVLTLSTFNDIAGLPLTMAAFGAKGYGTVEPGSQAQEEQISFTGIVPNVDGSVSLTGVKNVLFLSPYTETAGLQKIHAGGVRFVISNTSGFYHDFANTQDNETITQVWTFTVPNYPQTDNALVPPTLPAQLATKKYVDDTAISGAPNGDTATKGIWQGATPAQQAAGTDLGSTGAHLTLMSVSAKSFTAGIGDANRTIVANAAGFLDQTWLDTTRTIGSVWSFTATNLQVTTDAVASNDAVRYSKALDMTSQNAATGTSGEAFTVGAALYVKASDGRLYKTLGTGDESTYSFVGMALDAAAGAAVTGIRFSKPGGIAVGLAGLTAGSYYFITDAAGVIGVTPGTRFAKIGQALTTTTLRVCEPKFVKRGSTNISAVASTTITTGFYPAKIRTFAGSNGQGGRITGISVGDDVGSCAFTIPGNTASSQQSFGGGAWIIRNDLNSTTNAGTIDTFTQTGFNLNCSTHVVDATVIWEAESL